MFHLDKLVAFEFVILAISSITYDVPFYQLKEIKEGIDFPLLCLPSNKLTMHVWLFKKLIFVKLQPVEKNIQPVEKNFNRLRIKIQLVEHDK